MIPRYLFVTLLALAGSLGQQGVAQAQTHDLDAIAAVVNNDVVLYSELNRAGARIAKNLRSQGTPLPPQQVLARQVLERLIIQRLELQRAQETGIRVDDRTLNQAVTSIASNNKLSMAEFRRALLAEGYDYNSFREEIRDKIIIERLTQREIQNRVKVSEQEIDDYLSSQQSLSGNSRELHLAQIFVGIPEQPGSTDISTARSEALRLRNEALGGANFAKLAVANSDAGDALQGGDLGWVKQSELPTAFAMPLSRMATGDVSEPIRTPNGFYLLKVVATKGGGRHIVKQTHARHILIRVDERTSATTAKNKLTRLRARVQGGSDFGAIAKAQSDDTGSAVKGGDLGWVNPGDLVPQFEQVMDRLGPGQISQPFETPFGWHIVQVIDRRTQDNTSQFQRNQAREVIAKRKSEEALDAWLRQLRDEAYVDIRLGKER
jgi:peptidyl-prolyl cis-trans isomerase SurA